MTSPRSFSFPQSQVWSGKLGLGNSANTPPSTEKRSNPCEQITMAESFGVAGLGRVYDESGAIRDVEQNHLLQVVALLAMEPPTELSPRALHDEQSNVFRAIAPI